VERCQEALRSPHASPTTKAILRVQLAELHHRGGDVAAALALWDLGLPHLQAGTIDRGNALNNRGSAHLEHSRFDRAEEDFARAAAEFGTAGDELARVSALHNG